MRPPRSLLAPLAAATLVACGSPTSPEQTREVPPHATAAPAPHTLGRWQHADEVPGFRSVTRLRSQHLGNGTTDAEVLTNDAAGPYPSIGPARRLPVGSVILERLSPAGSPDVTAWFAMARPPGIAGDAGPWQFLVIRPDGELLARDPPGCARCHAEAPFDAIFGPPRAPTAAP